MNYICSRCGKRESTHTRRPKCGCGGLWDLEFSLPRFSSDRIDRNE